MKLLIIAMSVLLMSIKKLFANNVKILIINLAQWYFALLIVKGLKENQAKIF